ncbi:hypothetical protein RFI_28308, partial [Reticulomyxa filosa]
LLKTTCENLSHKTRATTATKESFGITESAKETNANASANNEVFIDDLDLQQLYTNYIIQMMLKLCKGVSLTNQLVTAITLKIDVLCYEKFASNVIEFCLSKCGESYQKQILDSLSHGYNKSALVADLVRNDMCLEHKNYFDDLVEQIQTNVFKTDLSKYPWKNYVNSRMDQLHKYANMLLQLPTTKDWSYGNTMSNPLILKWQT